MIFVIDDDLAMAKCIKKACQRRAKKREVAALQGLEVQKETETLQELVPEVRIFNNAITAMEALSDGLPEMIFLDVLLSGPDGFTFLNELVSYTDTMKIPVVIVSSLNFKNQDLSEYGVVGILDKSTMKPEEIYSYAEKYARC